MHILNTVGDEFTLTAYYFHSHIHKSTSVCMYVCMYVGWLVRCHGMATSLTLIDLVKSILHV